MSALRDYFGFESRSQLAAFITALASSEIPGKYAYVGESAKAYNAHALTKEYSQVTRSTASESALLPAVWGEDLAEIRTLVDVGPGNGLHSVGGLQQGARRPTGCRADISGWTTVPTWPRWPWTTCSGRSRGSRSARYSLTLRARSRRGRRRFRT